MNTIFGKFIKYVLWISLLTILSFLLIGLSKYNWSVSSYIQFLNNRNWNDAWQAWNIFWGTWIVQQDVNDNNGTGDSLSDTGIDVYDPSFEEDLNQVPQDDFGSGDASSAETGFGFVNADSSMTGSISSDTGTSMDWDSKAQLLELMKKREMNK